MKLEAAQNKQSLALSLNRTVAAERNNKPLVKQLNLATKQSLATKNNIQHYKTQLKSLTIEHYKYKQLNLQLQTTNDELNKTIGMLQASSPIATLQKENNNKKGDKKPYLLICGH